MCFTLSLGSQAPWAEMSITCFCTTSTTDPSLPCPSDIAQRATQKSTRRRETMKSMLAGNTPWQRDSDHNLPTIWTWPESVPSLKNTVLPPLPRHSEQRPCCAQHRRKPPGKDTPNKAAVTCTVSCSSLLLALKRQQVIRPGLIHTNCGNNINLKGSPKNECETLGRNSSLPVLPCASARLSALAVSSVAPLHTPFMHRHLTEGQPGVVPTPSPCPRLRLRVLQPQVNFLGSGQSYVGSADGRSPQLLQPVLFACISNLRLASPIFPPLIRSNFPFLSDTQRQSLCPQP